MGSVASFSSAETSDQLVYDILKRATTDPVKKNISIYLSSIGNSGNVEAIDFIKDHIDSDDTHIRSKALLSLRHMKGDKALNLFSDAFLQEKNTKVLKTAAESFRYLDSSSNFLETIRSSVLKYETNTELSNIILKKSYLNLKENKALDAKYKNMLINLSEACTSIQKHMLIKTIEKGVFMLM